MGCLFIGFAFRSELPDQQCNSAVQPLLVMLYALSYPTSSATLHSSPVLPTYSSVLQESAASTQAISKARRVWGSPGREVPTACSARGDLFNNLRSSTRVRLIAHKL